MQACSTASGARHMARKDTPDIRPSRVGARIREDEKEEEEEEKEEEEKELHLCQNLETCTWQAGKK